MTIAVAETNLGKKITAVYFFGKIKNNQFWNITFRKMYMAKTLI